MKRVAEKLRLPVAIREIANPQDAPDAGDDLPVVSTGHPANVEPGEPNSATAGGTIAAIDIAARFVRDGHAAAIVTNPIAKSVLYAAGSIIPVTRSTLPSLPNASGASRPGP